MLTLKQLTYKISRRTGRGSFGGICVRHRGGGSKRRVRIIDFRRNLWYLSGVVCRFEVDKGRSARVALVCYLNGVLSFVLSWRGARVGDVILNGCGMPLVRGNCVYLSWLPTGTRVSSVEVVAGGVGAQIARAGGTSVMVRRHTRTGDVVVSYPSRLVKEMWLSWRCCGVIGVAALNVNRTVDIGSAGGARRLGWRPAVRGVAMNPVDHPHGGGEGKTSGGRIPVSAWGRLTKGFRTRDPEKKRKLWKMIKRVRKL